jgi:hypothetical protein
VAVRHQRLPAGAPERLRLLDRYGSSILAEVEALVVRQGRTRLGLNVVSTNEAAIALYRKSGYAVSTMQMSKRLS